MLSDPAMKKVSHMRRIAGVAPLDMSPTVLGGSSQLSSTWRYRSSVYYVEVLWSQATAATSIHRPPKPTLQPSQERIQRSLESSFRLANI